MAAPAAAVGNLFASTLMINYPKRDWLPPWRSLTSDETKQLEEELRHETTPLHALYGKKVRAIARRTDNDEVLYGVSDDGRYAVVHLTWTGNNEENWPYVTFYDSLDEWVERVMEADHREFTKGHQRDEGR